MKSLPKMMFALAAAMALAGPVLPLAAQGAPSPIVLKGDVKVVKTVTDKDGKQRTELADPDTIVPGDRLMFGTDYANNGTQPVKNFVVTNPLPSAVRLAPDADPALEVSVDAGKTWGVLAKLSVANPDGTMRPATHDDVTHVRWTIATIAPGASGRVTYPAIIR
ncbi:hypothetical protein [Erythrobacter sp. WG]|uniref:hypothetical protein n=1 Tax=Erythrobacter sp. WG TaxID=2985510 RepID=UPI00226D4A61|nr:hypothetical protein [Erythrobacter sp. WG]MCX9147438.1 hypothetical protein [Erythrobacter sp. WG]